MLRFARVTFTENTLDPSMILRNIPGVLVVLVIYWIKGEDHTKPPLFQ